MKRYILILIILIPAIAGYLYFSVKSGKRTTTTNIITDKNDIVLYFSSEDEEYLVPEIREIKLSGPIETQTLKVIQELIKGSQAQQTQSAKGLINVIPDGVKVNGTRLNGMGALYIDFSRELKESHPGGSWAEMLTIYSIVDTITKNFPDIKRVKILIDGREIETLAGHIDTSKPLTKNMDIVRIDDERKG